MLIMVNKSIVVDDHWLIIWVIHGYIVMIVIRMMVSGATWDLPSSKPGNRF